MAEINVSEMVDVITPIVKIDDLRNQELPVFYDYENSKLGQPNDGDAGFDIYTPFDIVLTQGKSEINLPFKQEFFKLLMDAAETSEYIVSTLATTGFSATKIKTGIHVKIPKGYVGLIQDRSSMGAKTIKVLGGVIDSSYLGDVSVLLVNLTDKEQYFQAGSKIAQLVLIPIATPKVTPKATLEELGTTQRGEKGFGSTGN